MGKFSNYIGSQFGNPRGIVGKVCCVIMNVINRSMYQSIVSHMQADPGTKVLDIGYGNGRLAQKLLKRFGCRVSGIDISEDMKTAASARNRQAVLSGNAHFMVGDCCQMPFESESFDAICSVNTIYFWSDTKKGLREILRTLKKGGTFYNVVYSKQWLQKLSYTQKGFQFFEKEDYVALGKEAGFSKVIIKETIQGKSYFIQYIK